MIPDRSGTSLSADGLPPLREIIQTHGIAAKKALGQNFLLDLNLTGRIARVPENLRDLPVLEVGPGPGGLTRALLFEGAPRVIAIEPDDRCLPALSQISQHYDGKLEIILGDALQIDPATIFDGPYRIIANLPYNVGTQLLLNWLTAETWPPQWASLTLMFQKEVAERVVADPGSKAYGRLSVLAAWRTSAEIAFSVSPQAFTPPPKITSAIVHLKPQLEPLPCALRALETVTAAAFGQRRKMLRASLKGLGGQGLLTRAGIDETRRAETLSTDEFVALANAL